MDGDDLADLNGRTPGAADELRVKAAEIRSTTERLEALT
jgi:hypothetical protein